MKTATRLTVTLTFTLTAAAVVLGQSKRPVASPGTPERFTATAINMGTPGWTGATTVASVTSSFTSLVDASGSGTYRYSVRAKNPGGASAYAGPASVTVTSPTSGKRGGPKSR